MAGLSYQTNSLASPMPHHSAQPALAAHLKLNVGLSFPPSVSLRFTPTSTNFRFELGKKQNAKMADEELIPVSQKVRTISHMNNDHRLDLQHILQHFNNLNDYEARDPEMVDINLQFMTVKTPHTGRTHYIKFEPELANWAERRVKLVDMTHQARVGLGLEAPAEEDGKEEKGVVVREYMPPRPFDWVIFLAVLFYYFNFVATVKLEVLDGREWILDAFWPFGGHQGWMWLTKTIFWPVIVIHISEAAWLERSRLSKFGVERGSGVWWLWMGSCFIEGGMAFKRFDILVRRAEEKEDKKH
ncbi:hypothetical protein QC762_306070 [Podospora pseudocomata]|uniref:DUF2470 domain-containing protein n=1 Tax=Podospora pseudocomata TaxID=2093779 RepID=A0ABR0GJM1_9PEZI|nr:hypothetical protein QC762_306070 [Podospora pseudocomata]